MTMNKPWHLQTVDKTIVLTSGYIFFNYLQLSKFNFGLQICLKNYSLLTAWATAERDLDSILHCKLLGREERSDLEGPGEKPLGAVPGQVPAWKGDDLNVKEKVGLNNSWCE